MARPPTMRTIETPWTPYAVQFSPDGRLLAIGGGSFYGHGGIILFDLASGHSEQFNCFDVERGHRPGDPMYQMSSVSSVCFADDGRHLVASLWGYRHRLAYAIVLAVDDLRLLHVTELAPSYSDDTRSSAIATGILITDRGLLVRSHRAPMDEMIMALSLPLDLRAPRRQLGGQRLVVLGDQAVTGNHGELHVTFRPRGGRNLDHARAGRLIVAPLDAPYSATAVDAADCRLITAVARIGDQVMTGGLDGELDLWSRDRGWRQHRVRGATDRTEPPDDDPLTWATYTPNSIAGICPLPEGGAAIVSAGGELSLFDGGRLAAHPLRIMGSPRAIAAHPDGGALAIAIKQGDSVHGSIVEVLDLRAPIDPAWCTPTVRTLATAASWGDREAFAVLRDALEDRGAAPAILEHLRHHDHALRRCWVVDGILRLPR